MTELHSTDLALRFFGDDLDPNEITHRLGKSPTEYETKGQSIKNKTTGKVRIAKTGSWRFRVSRKIPGDLDKQIFEIFSGMTEDLYIWTNLSERFKADLFAGLFHKEENEGLKISSKSLQMIGERGLFLDLDIYYQNYL